VNGLKEQYKGDLYVEYVNIDAAVNRTLTMQYNASSIPLIVIFNDEGEVSAVFRGLTDPQLLSQAIDQALRESATSPNAVN
jgi:thioredoxin-like negative regulator of GroEL